MKALQGTIIKVTDPKTVSVLVTRKWQHPLYKKYVKRTKKYNCDSQDFKLKPGDTVLIEGCRPLSKTKHFKVTRKLKK